ncbi:hypothetical protein AVEN_92918-1 [Araneus ventricosus]|uniref:Uncharacterized protein n=1 Tax=Araneus ventricosus TaxID=182803 RepID=A0A4Y2D019_ARAVE|nr:hypothetical protein AVEN_92918-1 [Araneus ventricosus]
MPNYHVETGAEIHISLSWADTLKEICIMELLNCWWCATPDGTYQYHRCEPPVVREGVNVLNRSLISKTNKDECLCVRMSVGALQNRPLNVELPHLAQIYFGL